MRYWFRRKKYGYGWYPATWEGWILLLLYLIGVLGLTMRLYPIDKTLPVSAVMQSYIVPVLALTWVLIAICYITGEKPRWQWGDEENNEDEETNQ